MKSCVPHSSRSALVFMLTALTIFMHMQGSAATTPVVTNITAFPSCVSCLFQYLNGVTYGFANTTAAKSMMWCANNAQPINSFCSNTTKCGNLTGITIVTDIMSCNKVVPNVIRNITVSDNATGAPYLQVNTMTPTDSFHVITINTSMALNQSAASSYYNYGGSNLNFYDGPSAYVTKFTDLVGVPEGALSSETTTSSTLRFIYVLNYAGTQETYIITYQDASMLQKSLLLTLLTTLSYLLLTA